MVHPAVGTPILRTYRHQH